MPSSSLHAVIIIRIRCSWHSRVYLLTFGVPYCRSLWQYPHLSTYSNADFITSRIYWHLDLVFFAGKPDYDVIFMTFADLILFWLVSLCSNLTDWLILFSIINRFYQLIYFSVYLVTYTCLQCFDAVCWAAGRASDLQKTEWWDVGVVVWNKVQTCI